MNFDFSALLVLLTLVSGLIWGVDALFFSRRRRQDAAGRETERGTAEPLLTEYARSFFPIFLIVLILRSFIAEPFRIPSASMMPTLLIGDFILVNKYDYGIRLPVLNLKVINNGSPEKGDIIVFRYPLDPGIPYIKRVVGVPGDHITYYNKTLYVNGIPMQQEVRGKYKANGSGRDMYGWSLRTEKLADVDHDILVAPQGDPHHGNEGEEWVVPADNYFVMGDNRDNSQDSRYWGFVPDENLIGRAFMIWMNLDWKDKSINWKRIGTIM